MIASNTSMDPAATSRSNPHDGDPDAALSAKTGGVRAASGYAVADVLPVDTASAAVVEVLPLDACLGSTPQHATDAVQWGWVDKIARQICLDAAKSVATTPAPPTTDPAAGDPDPALASKRVNKDSVLSSAHAVAENHLVCCGLRYAVSTNLPVVL